MTDAGGSAPPATGLGKLAALAAVAAALVIGVLAAREFAVGRDAVAAADAAAAKSDWREAIAQARIAAESLTPASPWPERGLRQLQAMGHDAEARGDDATALLAYGAMRAAALETRAPGAASSRSDRWRHAAEEGLGRVAASSKDTPRSRLAATMESLRVEGTPSTLKLAALAASAFATLAALATLAWLACTGGSLRATRAAQGVAAAGLLAYAAVVWMG